VGRDFTTNIEPVLRPLLGDGERLVVASPLLSDPGTTEDLTAKEQLKKLLDPTDLFGLGPHTGGTLQRLVLGRAVIGAEGSIGRRLYDAVDGTTSVPDFALTDSRLLVFTTEIVNTSSGGGFFQRWFGPTETAARLAHEIPRNWILGAVPAAKGLLRRGRFFVTFIDGSGCALVCIHPSAGRRATEALGAPRLEQRATGEEHS
jgi:hypothetical protein